MFQVKNDVAYSHTLKYILVLKSRTLVTPTFHSTNLEIKFK